MINKFKKTFYFPIAHYFKFFAQIKLKRWSPRIVVITGSSGKTTLLHLIESQIQEKARYSHLANSSFGIPFDILGLKRTTLTPEEWLYLFFLAPFKAFKKPYKEKLYIVEADCDRSFEGKFLADLLKPSVTLWTNVSRTHTVNFDSVVIARRDPSLRSGQAPQSHPKEIATPRLAGFAMTRVEEVIAHEFGYFLQHTTDLAILNSDDELIKKESLRAKAAVKYIGQKNLNSYKIFKGHTEFKINGKDYSIKAILPKETSYSIQMTLSLLEFLKIKPDLSFSKFKLPPGRCNIFKGIKNTTIIDSSYNATPDGVKSILGMFGEYPSDKKWLVLGDMIELGEEEKEEHEKLADNINFMELDKVILVGPRVSKYTYPKLTPLSGVISTTGRRRDPPDNIYSNGISRYARNDKIKKFTMPKDALDYLLENLKGGEVILFKGARFLEGIIEHLLAVKNDVRKLCRREKIWQQRRKQWGL